MTEVDAIKTRVRSVLMYKVSNPNNGVEKLILKLSSFYSSLCKLLSRMKTFHTLKTKLETHFDLALPNLSQILIWLLGVVVLTTLTIRDFIPLLSEYTYNNVATQVEVVAIDGKFKPPKPVLCIPHYKDTNKEVDILMSITQYLLNGSESDCEVCEKLASESLDVWKNPEISQFAAEGAQAYYQALSLGLIKRLSENQSAFGDIIKNADSPVYEPVFSAALNFLMWKNKIEYYLAPSYFSALAALWPLFDIESEFLTDFAVHTLGGVCQGIGFSEKNLTNELVTSSGIQTNSTCLEALLRPTVPTILAPNCIWVPLPFSDRPKIKEYRFQLSKASPLFEKLWYPTGGSEAKRFYLYPDPGIQYLTSMDTDYSSYIYQTLLIPTVAHRITVRYSVQMRAKENRPGESGCYRGTSATVCLARCTKRYLIDKCKCVLFTIRNGLEYPPGTPYCSGAMLNACGDTSIPDEIQDGCLKRCKAACEYTAYTWQIDYDTGQPSMPNTTELFLRLIPTFNTFAEFTWTLKSTPEQFLSQIGGIVNFYLGFSGLSIFAFIVAVIGVVQRRRMRKTTVERSHGDLPL